MNSLNDTASEKARLSKQMNWKFSFKKPNKQTNKDSLERCGMLKIK